MYDKTAKLIEFILDLVSRNHREQEFFKAETLQKLSHKELEYLYYWLLQELEEG